MAYSKQTWHDKPALDTPVTKARLDHIEDGIEANSTDLAALEAALPGTYAPIAEVATRAAADAALDTRVDALEAGVGYDPNAVTVLRFSGAVAHHCNHGDFWPQGVDLGPFWWDAWVAPGANAGANYLVSDGNGGNHALLWGFQPGAGGVQVPTGNVFPGATPLVSFGSDDPVAVGEWAYHAVGWNGGTIVYYIDGILTGRTPFTGPRQAGFGQLYVCGSDHQNLICDLARLRGFEDHFPLTSPYVGFIPERHFGAKSRATEITATASFLADYTTPGRAIIPDLSDGYNGRVHPGTLNAGIEAAGVESISKGAVQSVPQIAGRPSYVVSTTAPFDVDVSRWSTGTIPAVPSVPAGAKVFDSFNRAKQSLVLATPTLGVTDGGSLGPLTWVCRPVNNTTTPYPYGIINGCAVPLMNGQIQSAAWVVTDSPNADVRVDRRSTAQWGTHDTGLCMRVQDGMNMYVVRTHGGEAIAATTIDVQKNTAGTVTTLGNFACPLTAWRTLRATFSGSTLTVYVDNLAGGWTQIGQLTGQSAFSAAQGFGIANYLMESSIRFDNFTVMP